MTAPTTAQLTVEEFLEGDFPPDSWLINGEVIGNDPSFEHQEIVGLLYAALRSWCHSPIGRGRAGFGGNWVMGISVLKPDTWWADEGRLPSGTRSDDPPDLAVEVRSLSTWQYDLGPKRTIYEEAGVRELWLVDPPGETIYVSRRSARTGGLDDVSEVGMDDPLSSPMLPGFELSVSELLAP